MQTPHRTPDHPPAKRTHTPPPPIRLPRTSCPPSVSRASCPRIKNPSPKATPPLIPYSSVSRASCPRIKKPVTQGDTSPHPLSLRVAGVLPADKRPCLSTYHTRPYPLATHVQSDYLSTGASWQHINGAIRPPRLFGHVHSIPPHNLSGGSRFIVASTLRGPSDSLLPPASCPR